MAGTKPCWQGPEHSLLKVKPRFSQNSGNKIQQEESWKEWGVGEGGVCVYVCVCLCANALMCVQDRESVLQSCVWTSSISGTGIRPNPDTSVQNLKTKRKGGGEQCAQEKTQHVCLCVWNQCQKFGTSKYVWSCDGSFHITTMRHCEVESQLAAHLHRHLYVEYVWRTGLGKQYRW